MLANLQYGLKCVPREGVAFSPTASLLHCHIDKSVAKLGYENVLRIPLPSHVFLPRNRKLLGSDCILLSRTYDLEQIELNVHADQ